MRSRSGITVAARRWIAALVFCALVLGLPVAFGHRGTHAALNLLIPGGGLFGGNTGAAVGFVVLTVASVAVWLRWGIDWLVIAVAGVAMTVSALSVHEHEPVAAVVRALPMERSAHEFPLVILVVGALSRLGRLARRLPPIGALRRRRRAHAKGFSGLDRLSPVTRCQAASIVALAGSTAGEQAALTRAVARPDVARRARRVGVVARGRVGGDPFRVDHAHARTAMALTGQLTPAALDRFVIESAAGSAHVPCSEPTWVRPLDATLASVTLHRLGRADAITHLRELFRDRLPLRRGHRPGWWWTVLGVHGGSSPDWEHAASTAIARAVGAVGNDDWQALRRRALGAAARGTTHPHDERLIAAARVWLAYVHDDEAAIIVARPTVRHDALAVALDRLATRLHSDPDSLAQLSTNATGPR